MKNDALREAIAAVEDLRAAINDLRSVTVTLITVIEENNKLRRGY